MKKRIFLYLLLIAYVISVSIITYAAQNKNESNEIIFFSKGNTDVEQFIITKEETIIEIIGQCEGYTGEISVGKPISVRGVSEYYYVPVFSQDKCINIITVSKYEDDYIMKSGKSFSEVINGLPKNETYYFEKMFEADPYQSAIYIKGRNTKIAIEAFHSCDYRNECNGEQDLLIEEDENEVTFPVDYIANITIPSSNRSSGYITVSPRFQNGGQYGYCWLCCACEISSYYGGSGIGLEGGHLVSHGSPQSPYGHSLYSCPGGSMYDVNAVVYYYTGKSGTITTPLYAAATVSSINNQKPIVSGWIYSSGSTTYAHAMVIVGYNKSDYSNNFMYVVHDPNNIISDNYVSSSYSATNVVYPINGYNLSWVESIYNWN